MLKEIEYIQPYIPSTPHDLAYVGGELERLTSNTPFWASQGIPIYPVPVNRMVHYGGCGCNQSYNGALGDKLKAWLTPERKTKIKEQGKGLFSWFQNRQQTTTSVAPMLPTSQQPQPQPQQDGMGTGTKVALGVAGLAGLGILFYVATKD